MSSKNRPTEDELLKRYVGQVHGTIEEKRKALRWLKQHKWVMRDDEEFVEDVIQECEDDFEAIKEDAMESGSLWDSWRKS